MRLETMWNQSTTTGEVLEVNEKLSQRGNDLKLVRDAFDSKGGFEDGSYLVEFPAEQTRALGTFDKFGERKRLAQHQKPGDFKRTISTWMGYLNQEGPTLSVSFGNSDVDVLSDDKFEEWSQIMTDADRRGHGLKEVAAIAEKESLIAGASAVLVDAPTLQEGQNRPTDITEIIARNLVPFLRIICIEHILDYEYDYENSRFEWVKLAEGQLDFASGKYATIKVWTRTRWIAFDGDSGQFKAENIHPVGEVPIAIFQSVDNAEHFYTKSIVEEIAHLDVHEFNIQSEKREVERSAAFPLRFGPKLAQDDKKTGTSNYLQVERGDPTPGQINVDAACLDALGKSILDCRAKKRELSLIPETTGEPIPMSGVSRSYLFRNLEMQLVSLSKGFEKPVRDVLYYCAKFLNPGLQPQGITIKVAYPKSYKTHSISDVMGILQEVTQIPGAPPTLVNYLWESVAQMTYPMDSGDLMEKTKAEIEKGIQTSFLSQPEPTDIMQQLGLTA